MFKMSYTYNEIDTIKNQMEVDHKIIKRIYPRTNNKTSLEFVLEKDPNLYLRMHTMKLYLTVTIPKDYAPDIALPSKLFLDLRVDLDSQNINSSSTRYDHKIIITIIVYYYRSQFFLHDILSKMANYNWGYVTGTLGQLEGYGLTPFSCDRSSAESYLTASPPQTVLEDRELMVPDGNIDKTTLYVLSLEGGILTCPQPLLNNTEVKLSLDRALASISLLYREYGRDVTQPTTMDNKPLELIDPYLEVEYVSSPYLRNFYSQIVDRPITFRYDDCDIYMKTVSNGQSMIRVNNVMGGLTPDYLFAGMVKTDAINGDFNLSSTNFFNPGYKELCITLNGMPVQGYPMSIDEPAVKMYSKFIDTIGKSKKSIGGSTIDCRFFTEFYCWISHHFEGEQTNEGWIGLDVKLSKPLDDDVTLGKLRLFLYVI